MGSKYCDYCNEVKDHVYEKFDVSTDPHIKLKLSPDGKSVQSVIKNKFICADCDVDFESLK